MRVRLIRGVPLESISKRSVAKCIQSFRMKVEPCPKNCHDPVHDCSMMRRAPRPTPTQRQWRKMKRKRQRRVAAPTIGLFLISVSLVLAVAFQVVPGGFGQAIPTKTALRPTALRGGNAWGGTTSDPMSTSGSFVGRVTHVRDGDTIEVSGRPIRFAKLDCAEIGTPAGRQADRHMRALVSGKTLSCSLTGRKSYDRWIGSCHLPDGRDLASVMVTNGSCPWWRG